MTCAQARLPDRARLQGGNAALAVARGEMDALYVTDTSASHYAQANGLIPLVTEAVTKKAVSDPKSLAEGGKRQLYTDYVDAAGTRANAMSIVTNVTPKQRKLVPDVLAKAG
jgi:hypothetical protein